MDRSRLWARKRPASGLALLLALTLLGLAVAIYRVTTAGPGVVVGAGDIASCDSPFDEATAALLENLPGTVVTLGDNAYESGTTNEFTECYAPSWGRHRARTRPVPGNHDYY